MLQNDVFMYSFELEFTLALLPYYKKPSYWSNSVLPTAITLKIMHYVNL